MQLFDKESNATDTSLFLLKQLEYLGKDKVLPLELVFWSLVGFARTGDTHADAKTKEPGWRNI